MSVDFPEVLDDMIEVGVKDSTWKDAVQVAGRLLSRGCLAAGVHRGSEES